MNLEQGRMFSHKALTEKSKKNLTILNHIRDNGPVSFGELLELTEMKPAFLSAHLKEYSGKGIISGAAADGSEGDSDKKTITLAAGNNYAIGLDVGDPDIRAVVTDMSLKVLVRKKVSMTGKPKDAVARIAVDLMRSLIGDAGVKSSDVKAVGIGVPNNNAVNLQELIKRELGMESFSGNDASCAAFGEKTFNKEATAENILFMYSDVGCGIVIKGDIYFGAAGNAGGVQVSDEKMGSRYLKPWGGDLGIEELARKEAAKGVGTKMVELAGWRIDAITKNMVVAAARAKDEVASDIISYAGRNLGVRVAYLVNLFNPEIVFIGGGIERAGDLILRPIKEAVQKLAFAGPAGAAKILPSVLGEDAVSSGAAALAAREIFIRA